MCALHTTGTVSCMLCNYVVICTALGVANDMGVIGKIHHYAISASKSVNISGPVIKINIMTVVMQITTKQKNNDNNSVYSSNYSKGYKTPKLTVFGSKGS